MLLEYPELGSRLDNNLRHFVLRRFPFSIVYSSTADVITSLPLRTEAESQSTGDCVFKTDKKAVEGDACVKCVSAQRQRWAGV